MKHYIEGKTIIVTGGSSGFGLETSRLLLEMGSKIVITGRNARRLENAREYLSCGNNLLAVQADACVTKDWDKIITKTLEAFGTIDVLVNNHGAGVQIDPLETLDDQTIDEILDINLASVIKGSKRVLKVMKPNERGHIVNVSSVCARYGWSNFSVYSAAKGGLVAFTKCLHLEMAQWGGKASLFVPGAAKTNFCKAASLDDSFINDNFPSATDFARTIVHTIDVPDNCVVQDVTIWGTEQLKEINPF